MAKKTSSKESKKPEASDTQFADREWFSKWALEGLGGYALGELLPVPDELRTSTGTAVMKEIVMAVDPRDPLERMLVEQMVWCHQRIRHLQRLSFRAGLIRLQLSAHEQCEKAMATYRRGMLALKEYRATQRGMPLVAIQQVNQADRREVAVVATSPGNKNATNEVGANDGNGATDRSKSGEPKALEGPQQGRVGTPSRRRAKKQAVA